MSDSSSSFTRFVYNSLLVGSTCFAMYKISFQACPFGFSACVVGCSYGCFGLINTLFVCHNEDECRKMKDIYRSLLEITPLPLVNIELYLMSQGTSSLALGHGVFMLPLIFDVGCCIMKDRPDCATTTALKDLTVLGNIISITFLAVNERNFLYMRMAISAFLTKYGTMVFDRYEGNGDNVQVLGSSGFYYLTALALAESV